MNVPRVSVISACRNARSELPQTAHSVLSALGAQDEWVVQDGASTDGSREYVAGIRDDRIRMESEPDDGIYDALNRAIARARGDFLLILGADDRLRIHLDTLRPRLVDPNCIYYGDVWRVTSRDRYAGAFDGAKLARTNICQQAMVYPRRVFAFHQFDRRYPLQADWALNMACFADSRFRFAYMDLVIADYGQSGASSLHFDHAFQQDYPSLLRRHFTLRQRWLPHLLFKGAALYRALPGVPAPRQRPARKQ